MGNGNFEKFRADFGREADQNSKNKAVPRYRLQHKEAPKFRGEALDFMGTVRRFRSSPNRRFDCFSQEAAGR